MAIQVGFQEGDSVTLTFDVATNQCEILSWHIDQVLHLSDGHQWGNASWNEDELTVTLGTGSHTVSIGDWIRIDSPENIDTIMDETWNYVAIGSLPRITPQPRIVYVEAVPAAGPYFGIQDGDLVQIWFNFPTNEYPISLENIDDVLQLSDGVNTHTWGSVLSATWETNSEFSRLDVVGRGAF